jgi:hypothetical protein
MNKGLALSGLALAHCNGLWWLMMRGLMISKSLKFHFRMSNKLDELSHIGTCGKSLAYRNLGGGALENTT